MDRRPLVAPSLLTLEIASAGEAQEILDRLELHDALCYVRQPGDAHIPLVTEAIQSALADIAPSHLVLTANGRFIQNLRTRNSGVIDYHVKAYWAPGKTGLE